MAKAADLKRGEKPEVVISRSFAAPRELVFKAWSTAEHMKRWFSPEGCSVPEATVDFRPGGVCEICMRLPDGQDFWSGRVHRDRAAGPAGLRSASTSGRTEIHRPHHRHIRSGRGRNAHERAAGL